MYEFIIACSKEPQKKDAARIPTFSDLDDYIHYAMTNMGTGGYSDVVLMDGDKVIKTIKSALK